jgi:hypothetical protein
MDMDGQLYGKNVWTCTLMRVIPEAATQWDASLRGIAEAGQFHLELTPEMARITRKNQLPNPMFWDIFWM